jgi:hypothetical protein
MKQGGEMARTSTVIWSLIGGVVAILGILALIYGPGLYREGKALVGPIVELAQIEERLAELDTEMPFEIPNDGIVSEERFAAFLDIRRELLPHYQNWEVLERQLQRTGEEDWAAAKEALAAIREILSAQLDALTSHEMPPAEFIWIEDLVYVTWADKADLVVRANAANRRLKQVTADDLAHLEELEARYGSSRTTRRFAEHLDLRIRALESPQAPSVEGLAVETSALFWAHRDEIERLDFAPYTEMHRAIRGGGVNVQIEDD